MKRSYILIGISLFLSGLVLIIGISLAQRNNSVTAQQNATPNPNLETTFLNMSELGISVTLKKR